LLIKTEENTATQKHLPFHSFMTEVDFLGGGEPEHILGFRLSGKE
jgi:hypothetical protein